MERNFDNKDFEQFLKQNADQYRMHPSEKVWTEINNTLHPRRRWYAIAASLLFLTGAVVSGVMILHPGTDSQSVSAKTKTNTQSIVAENKTSSELVAPILTNPSHNRSIASNRIPTIINNYSVEDPIEIVHGVAEQVSPTIPTVSAHEKIEKGVLTLPVNNNNDLAFKAKNTIMISPVNHANIAELKVSPVAETNNAEKNKPAADILKPSLMVSDLPNKVPATSKNTSSGNKRKKSITWQLYFTPGISYRRLTENKEAILAASGGAPSIPSNLALSDIKNLVTHKPDIGFELGLSARYPITKNIFLKTGFQFNVNKYNIHAFNYVAEPATIAIQGGGTSQSISRVSYYRNFNGYNPNWLTNVYFSLSIPVGFELNFVNSKKINVGLGLTLQPTYLLDNRAYLISTDFKNYTKVPDLIRRWNLNTGAELIFGFKAGKTKFQIGPQMRYQTLSSFKDKYPVKENLFNFGLKAGVSLNR